jgi:hypothetical protein
MRPLPQQAAMALCEPAAFPLLPLDAQTPVDTPVLVAVLM